MGEPIASTRLVLRRKNRRQYAGKSLFHVLPPQRVDRLDPAPFRADQTRAPQDVIVARHPSALAYSATKGWVDSFTRSLAGHLAPRNITVNAIAPGVIRTDMSDPMLSGGPDFVLERQALKRIGEPQDIANLALAIAGAGGGWTTGQVIDASGGSAISF